MDDFAAHVQNVPRRRSATRVIARVTAWATLLAASAAIVVAGDPPASSGKSDEEIERLLQLHHAERESVRLVQVPAVVTTRRGKIVKGLTKQDFRLLEDRVPQQIRYFGTEGDQPVSIAFVLDVSGSMRQVGKLDEAKQAIRDFVDSLRQGDRFGLVCFADEQVAWVTEFTDDRERFLKRLAVQQAYGMTALYDAIAAAPELVDQSVQGSRAIVLITDGIDTASHMNMFDAVTMARSANVPIYTIGFSTIAARLRPPGSRRTTERILQRFADETGGRLFSVRDPDELKEAVLEIQSELRFRYILGYNPGRLGWDGSFRRIRVETVRDRLQVRARSGYYARP